MEDTKENILLVSLRLFAKKGYEAVSVSDIASKLGMVKSSLYKHYKNKQAIFDSILNRIDELDNELGISKQATDYISIPFASIKEMTMLIFKHWTEEEIPRLFRQMLVIEKSHNPKMKELYQLYLLDGPISFMEPIFESIAKDKIKGKLLAVEFYGPIFFLYFLYDEIEDKESVKKLVINHIEKFEEKMR